MKKRVLPPTYLLISIATMVLLHFLAPDSILAPYPWSLLGMVLILFGIAIFMGSFTPIIVVVIFGILIELVFVRTEEKMLEQQFGPSWDAYKGKVRKWI